MLDPEAPIEREDSVASTKNMFKATFGEISKYNCLVVVILPFRVPDNLCHFAAQEATMVIDQFLKPDFEEQINRKAEEQDVFKKLDCYFSSIIYQVQTLAFGANDAHGEVNFKQFLNLAVGSSAMQLPSILSVNTNYMLQMDRRCQT